MKSVYMSMPGSAQPVERDSVFNMHAKADHESRTAREVVSRIVDMLIVECQGDSAPEVRGVIGLEGLFETIFQPPCLTFLQPPVC